MGEDARVPGPKGGPPAPTSGFWPWLFFIAKVAGAILVISGILIPVVGYGVSCFIKEDIEEIQKQIGETETRLETVDSAIVEKVTEIAEDVSYARGVLDTIRGWIEARIEEEPGGNFRGADSANDDGPPASEWSVLPSSGGNGGGIVTKSDEESRQGNPEGE